MCLIKIEMKINIKKICCGNFSTKFSVISMTKLQVLQSPFLGTWHKWLKSKHRFNWNYEWFIISIASCIKMANDWHNCFKIIIVLFIFLFIHLIVNTNRIRPIIVIFSTSFYLFTFMGKLPIELKIAVLMQGQT